MPLPFPFLLPPSGVPGLTSKGDREGRVAWIGRAVGRAGWTGMAGMPVFAGVVGRAVWAGREWVAGLAGVVGRVGRAGGG